jgi:hypothetical protein
MVQARHLIDDLRPVNNLIAAGEDTGDQDVHVTRIDGKTTRHRAIDLDLGLGVLCKNVKTIKFPYLGRSRGLDIR